MRKRYNNLIDNMAQRRRSSNQRQIDNTINVSVGNQKRTSKNVRSGLYDWGAFQMRNMQSNDFAMFGAPFSGNTVGA